MASREFLRCYRIDAPKEKRWPLAWCLRAKGLATPLQWIRTRQHPATIRAIHGRHEVLAGPAIEEIMVLEFPTYHRAMAWWQSPEYQAACERRFQGGDYRGILTEGQP